MERRHIRLCSHKISVELVSSFVCLGTKVFAKLLAPIIYKCHRERWLLFVSSLYASIGTCFLVIHLDRYYLILWLVHGYFYSNDSLSQRHTPQRRYRVCEIAFDICQALYAASISAQVISETTNVASRTHSQPAASRDIWHLTLDARTEWPAHKTTQYLRIRIQNKVVKCKQCKTSSRNCCISTENTSMQGYRPCSSDRRICTMSMCQIGPSPEPFCSDWHLLAREREVRMLEVRIACLLGCFWYEHPCNGTKLSPGYVSYAYTLSTTACPFGVQRLKSMVQFDSWLLLH